MKNPFFIVFKERTYLKKLLIGMIVIAIIPTYLISAIMYNTYSARLIDEISNANLKLLGQVGIYFDSILDEIAITASNNSLDSDILYISQTHFYDDSIIFNNTSSKLQNLMESYKNIDSVITYFNRFDYIIGNPYGTPWGFYYKNNIEDQSWLKLFKENETNRFIVRDLPKENDRCLSLIRPIKDKALKTQAVMVFSVSWHSIYQRITRLKTNSLEEIYIIDARGNIVFNLGNKNDEDISEIIPFLKIGEGSYVINKKANDSKIVSYMVSPNSGWRFVSVTSKQKLLSKLSLYQNLSILVALIIITLSIAFSLLYGRYLYKPVLKIIKNITGSNVKDKVQGDELLEINKAFENVVSIKNNLQRFIDDNKNAMKDKLLNNILYGYDYNWNELNEKLNFFGVNIQYNFFCVVLIRTKISFFNTGTGNKNQISLKIYMLTLIEQLLAETKLNGIVFETSFENIAILLNFDSISSEEIKPALIGFTENLNNTLNMKTPMNISAGVGFTIQGFDRICESYQQAAKALDYSMVAGINRTIFFDDIFRDSKITLLSDKYEKKISNLINDRNRKKLNSLVDEIVRDISTDRSITHENIVNFFIQLLSHSIKALEKTNLKVYRSFLEKPLYTDFLLNHTIEDMGQWLKDLYDKFFKALGEYEEKKGSYKIEVVESYIQENYHRDLTLSSVAEKVNLNPNYLSCILKEETGKSFIDYLNMMRIEKSKELLTGSDMKIYEIALNIGFANDRSFTRYFRKYVGCTPGQYREALFGSDIV